MRMKPEIPLVALAAAACALLVMCDRARGEDWVVMTTNAWHASNHNRGADDTQFNEGNFGLGIEHRISENNKFVVGYYDNSFDRHSNYIGDLYQPFVATGKYGTVRLGVFAGNVTGYPSTRDMVNAQGRYEGKSLENKTFNPLILPTVSYEYGRVGVNVEVLPVPPLSQRAILGFQVKYKVD